MHKPKLLFFSLLFASGCMIRLYAQDNVTENAADLNHINDFYNMPIMEADSDIDPQINLALIAIPKQKQLMPIYKPSASLTFKKKKTSYFDLKLKSIEDLKKDLKLKTES